MRNKRRTDEEWLSLIQQCRSSGFSDPQELALSLQPPANFFQFPHPGCPHQNHPVYCNYPRFPRRSAGRKSEQHKRKRHEDN